MTTPPQMEDEIEGAEHLIRRIAFLCSGHDEDWLGMLLDEIRLFAAASAAAAESRGYERREMEEAVKVTRFEVIDETGRAYVRGRDSVKIELSYQDDGRTLKVFVRERMEKGHEDSG